MLEKYRLYILQFVTCTNIVISDCVTFTFELIPEHDPSRD
jgi:hypothetical protein